MRVSKFEAVLLTAIWAVCAVATERRTLHLFDDEVALLKPAALFTLSANAQLLRSAAAVPVSETEVEGDWHSGPTLSVRGELFFTVVTTDSLQVWNAAGRELQKLWETEGPAHSLTPVSIGDFDGFVFVRYSQLYAINLRVRPIALQCFSDLEIHESSRVVVCQGLNRAATVHLSPSLMVIQQYLLDFQQMAATSHIALTIDLESEGVLDGVCTSSFFFLQSRGVYITNDVETHFLHLPNLPYTSLKAIPNSDLIYAASENSVAVVTNRKVLVLPETIQVLSFTQQLVSVSANHSVYVRESAERWLSEAQQTRIEVAAGEYQWVQSIDLDLLLVKESQKLRLYLVEIDPVLVALSGRGAPYTVDICGPAKCVAVSVELAGSAETIRLKNSSDSDVITVKEQLEGTCSSFTLDFFEYISGVNLNVTFALTQTPSEFSVSAIRQFKDYFDETLIKFHTKVHEREFLCASIVKYMQQVILWVDGSIFTLPAMDYIESIKLERAVCEFFGEDLFIYGEAEGRLWLYRQSRSAVKQKELREIDGVLVAMVSTVSHIVLLFPTRIEILHVATDEWQSVEGRFLGLCSDEDTLVLLSQGAIEFLVSVGGLYIPRAKAAVHSGVLKCAYTQGTLVLLDESDTLTVYFVSSSFQLLKRYSLSTDCDVAGISISKYFCVYRCPDYYQVLDLDATKGASLVARNSLSRNVVLLEIDESYLILAILNEKELIIQKSGPINKRTLRYEVAVTISDHVKLSMPLEFSGLLSVSSSAGAKREFGVRFTLESHGAILSQSKPLREVQWQEATFTPSHYFSGHNLRFSANATDPTATVTVQQPLTPLYSLPLSATPNAIAVSVRHSLVFTPHNDKLTVSKYQCEGEVCRVISRNEFSLDFPIIVRFEVVLNTEELVYLLIFGKYFSSNYHCKHAMILYSLDPRSMKLSVLFSDKRTAKFHSIKASDSLYHVFLYGGALTHCTLCAPALSCTEVLHSSLYGIVTLGSHQVSSGHWEVYALTDSHRFITMSLTDSLSIIADSREYVSLIGSMASNKIVGRMLIVFVYKSLLIYSIPTFTLIRKIPTTSQSVFADFETWTYDSMDNSLIAIREKTVYSVLIDISTGFVLKRTKGAFISMSSDTVVCFFNQSLAFLRVCAGAVRVERGRESSVDVVVSASNELSEGAVQVRVVWAQCKWPALLLVGAVVCSSLQCRKRVRRSAEVEMQTISVGDV